MSELLNSGKVGMTAIKGLAEQRKKIISNWSESGLLEGLRGIKQSNVAQLLENQAGHMINEVTTDTSAGRFDTVAFPIVRRVFSRLLANELVSVQPLALPSGLIFYMDFRVSFNGSDNTLQNPSTRNSAYITNSNSQKLPPLNNAIGNSGPVFADTTAYERFYANNGIDMSFGSGYTVVGTTNTVGTLSASQAKGLLSINNFALGSSFVVSSKRSSATLRLTGNTNIYFSAGTNAKELVYTAGNIISGSGGGTGGSTASWFSQRQTWGEDAFNAQTMDIILDFRPASYQGSNDTVTLVDSTGVALTSVEFGALFEIYADLEANSYMAEATMRFNSTTITTDSRKMRAHWTPELAQDLEAYHSIDAEAELTAFLSEEIASEIDREIIVDLINGAPHRARWDYAGLSNNANFFGTQKDWNQTLITRINELSAQIHKSTLRGGANWIVCSAEAGAIFDDLEYFHVDGSASPESEKFNMGVEKIGNLGSRYVVYKDPYLPAQIVLLGHKGTSFLEAGYVYAPYIPLQLTQTIIDPNDFTPRKGIMTRYGKAMINNKFYGVVIIDNINRY